MPNVPIDTPDYQRGIVNPQQALSVGHAGTGVADVAIPPNCEALIVVLVNPAAGDSVAVTGDTTGFSYPGIASFTNKAYQSSRTWFFDVTNTLDAACTVHVVAANGGAWAVYADAGVHIVGDVARYTNHNGSQYVVPTVPNVEAGDHPPNEIRWVSALMAASGTVLSAPGAGQRYRVFEAFCFPNATSVFGYLMDSISGAAFVPGSQQAAGHLGFIPQGMPLSTNAAINYLLQGGSGNMYVQVLYTQETV